MCRSVSVDIGECVGGVGELYMLLSVCVCFNDCVSQCCMCKREFRGMYMYVCECNRNLCHLWTKRRRAEVTY